MDSTLNPDLWPAILALLLVSCAQSPPPRADASQAPDASAAADASAAPDASVAPDASAAPDASPALDASPAPDASQAPASCRTTTVSSPPLVPTPNELFIAHLGLGGISLGESTLVHLPDGKRALIDVGNDAHSDDVLDAVDTFFGTRDIDLVILTHHHADHEDAVTDLLDDLRIDTLIHRGLTDLTPAANDATIAALCAARTSFREIELCPNPDRRCAMSAWTRTATACSPHDNGALHLLAANAIVGAESLRPLKSDDSNGENARSVVGYLAHGHFRYVFAGDLTGGGSDTDAAEAFYVRTLGARLPAADVIHLSHHARDTSSSPAWLAHVLPADGRPRNAAAGISTAHVGSPHASVVRDVRARLLGGDIFVTRVAPAGAGAGVVDANGGTIRILTRGDSYLVQAVSAAGLVISTRETTSALGCTAR